MLKGGLLRTIAFQFSVFSLLGTKEKPQKLLFKRLSGSNCPVQMAWGVVTPTDKPKMEGARWWEVDHTPSLKGSALRPQHPAFTGYSVSCCENKNLSSISGLACCLHVPWGVWAFCQAGGPQFSSSESSKSCSSSSGPWASRHSSPGSSPASASGPPSSELLSSSSFSLLLLSSSSSS